MMQIRRFRVGDEEALRRICRDTTLRVNIDEYGSELVEKWTSNLGDASKWKNRVSRVKPFVAECAGIIVGFAELSATGRIGALYSHHDWLGRGVGKALYRAVESEASQRGMTILEVDSSVGASGFFEARGFQIVEERVTLTEGIPSKSLYMEKQLDRAEGRATKS